MLLALAAKITPLAAAGYIWEVHDHSVRLPTLPLAGTLQIEGVNTTSLTAGTYK